MQICSTFPPNIDGDRNYAKLLADYLKKDGLNQRY